MGYPVGCYSELLAPRYLIHLFFLLGSLRWLISRALDAVGLGDLLDSDDPWPADATHFRSVSTMLIDEALPVVRHKDLIRSGGAHYVAGECAVCLCDFDGGEEVRRLTNCRHVFHRCCLDRWMGHDQSLCPLCRAPLFPEELAASGAAFNDGIWASAGIPDSYESTAIDSFPLAPTTEALFLPNFLLFQNY